MSAKDVLTLIDKYNELLRVSKSLAKALDDLAEIAAAVHGESFAVVNAKKALEEFRVAGK